MDNQILELENRWVNECIASLGSSQDWQPDAEVAFERLLHRQESNRKSRWIRMPLMVGTVVGICLVVLVLPWHALWKSIAESKSVAPAPMKAVAIPEATLAPVPMLLPRPPLRSQPPAIVPAPPPEVAAPVSEQGPAEHAALVSPVLRPPVVISMVEPGYTDEARKAGIYGAVTLHVLIRADGTLKVIKVINGLGYGLDESAIKAAEQSKFQPGTRDGQPVDVETSLVINFRTLKTE